MASYHSRWTRIPGCPTTLALRSRDEASPHSTISCVDHPMSHRRLRGPRVGPRWCLNCSLNTSPFPFLSPFLSHFQLSTHQSQKTHQKLSTVLFTAQVILSGPASLAQSVPRHWTIQSLSHYQITLLYTTTSNHKPLFTSREKPRSTTWHQSHTIRRLDIE